MALIVAIFNAIAAIPSLFSSIQSAVQWLSDQMDQAAVRKASADMQKAIADAKKSKDTSGIDQIFDPGKKK